MAPNKKTKATQTDLGLGTGSKKSYERTSADKMKAFMAKYQMKGSEFGKRVGVANSTISNWKSNNDAPMMLDHLLDAWEELYALNRRISDHKIMIISGPGADVLTMRPFCEKLGLKVTALEPRISD